MRNQAVDVQLDLFVRHPREARTEARPAPHALLAQPEGNFFVDFLDELKATLQLNGKTATGIEVPEKIVESLGHGKRPPVRVTITGYTYPSTVAPMGGTFMLPVSAEVREV